MIILKGTKKAFHKIYNLVNRYSCRIRNRKEISLSNFCNAALVVMAYLLLVCKAFDFSIKYEQDPYWVEYS